MNAEKMTSISFIIPAYNEEEGIADTLSSITCGEIQWPYEIIVVDHNSTDKTAKIASDQGAKLISAKGGTIAGVRNTGVKASKGTLIVFLDADVSLTAKWFANFEQVVGQLSSDSMIVTGSHCNAPAQGNWIEKYWFSNLTHEVRVTHLGTGHMIVTRELFERVNGFDESLETGEDYSFCMKVKNAGGCIINNPNLYVVHRDYPKSVVAFIRREAWHGMGDVASFGAMTGSKVALVSLAFIAFHLLILLAMLVSEKPGVYTGLLIFNLVVLLLFSSWKKFNHCSLKVVLINGVVFYLYFSGRSLSLFRKIFSR